MARRSVVPWLLAVALVPIAPARGENRPIPLEPALVQSLREIEAAFRAGDAGRLEEVLPRESRVLVALSSLSHRKGYFAPDQVVLIFRSVFEAFPTERFELDLERGSLTRGELYYVPAAWSTRQPSSAVKDCHLQFMIRKEGSSYFIREIKEVR